jgi:hypothetical protein
MINFDFVADNYYLKILLFFAVLGSLKEIAPA